MAVSTMSQQQDNTSGILTTITTARQGSIFQKGQPNGQLCRFLIGNKSSSMEKAYFLLKEEFLRACSWLHLQQLR